MYHFIYKTTNLINGKFYLGKRSTKNLDDGYLGSGNSIKLAITKYGKENFKREILCYTETKELNAELEALLIDESMTANPMCYNIALGGQGGIGPAICRTPEQIKEGARKSGIKQAGRSKDTHPHLLESGKKHSRRFANMTEDELKEHGVKSCAWMQDTEKLAAAKEKAASKIRGRTKENHEGRAAQAEKISTHMREWQAEHIATITRGRTKENHEGRARQAVKVAETLGGRTKEDYEYLQDASARFTGEGNPMFGKHGDSHPGSKLTNDERLHVIELYEGGVGPTEIHKLYKDKVSIHSISIITKNREKIKTNLIPGYQTPEVLTKISVKRTPRARPAHITDELLTRIINMVEVQNMTRPEVIKALAGAASRSLVYRTIENKEEIKQQLGIT